MTLLPVLTVKLFLLHFHVFLISILGWIIHLFPDYLLFSYVSVIILNSFQGRYVPFSLSLSPCHKWFSYFASFTFKSSSLWLNYILYQNCIHVTYTHSLWPYFSPVNIWNNENALSELQKIETKCIRKLKANLTLRIFIK